MPPNAHTPNAPSEQILKGERENALELLRDEPKLDDPSGWSKWSSAIKRALKTAGNIWSQTIAQEPPRQPSQHWTQVNNYVRGIIMSKLGETPHSTLDNVDIDLAYNLWVHLESIFCKVNLASLFERFAALDNIRYENYKDVNSYSMALWGANEDLGRTHPTYKLNPQTLNLLFLQKLGESWRPWISSFIILNPEVCSWDDTKRWSFVALHKKIQEAENIFGSQQVLVVTTHKGLQARGAATTQDRPKCGFCKRTSHNEDNCHDKQRASEKAQQRAREFIKNGRVEKRGRGRGSARGSRDRSTLDRHNSDRTNIDRPDVDREDFTAGVAAVEDWGTPDDTETGYWAMMAEEVPGISTQGQAGISQAIGLPFQTSTHSPPPLWSQG